MSDIESTSPNHGGPGIDSRENQAIIASLAQKGLDKYLADVDLVQHLIDWLHEELDLPKALLRLALKPVASLVKGAVREGGMVRRGRKATA